MASLMRGIGRLAMRSAQVALSPGGIVTIGCTGVTAYAGLMVQTKETDFFVRAWPSDGEPKTSTMFGARSR